MMQNPRTLAAICKRHDLDLDETLIAVWDAGFDTIDDPDTPIPAKMLRRVLQSLDIEGSKKQSNVAYWEHRLGMTREQLAEELATLDIVLPPAKRRLPPGAQKKLRRKYFDTPAPATTADVQLEPSPPFAWRLVGSQTPSSYLVEEDILAIHAALVADFANAADPIAPPGVKEPRLIDSAVHRPLTSMGNELKYPTVELAAAALMHSLVHNHCFFNGNKRTALVAMLTFLDRNGHMAHCDETELFRFTLNLARHRIVPNHYDNLADREVLEAAQWIRAKSRPFETGDRTIPWLRLKRILRRYGCEFTSPTRGNRLNITRTIHQPQRRRRRRPPRTLHSQVKFASDGHDVMPHTIRSIRLKLELAEEHGIDSGDFYEEKAIPDDFVKKYAKTLHRLGRI